NTTHANQYGIIYKNGNRFLHDFNYGDNGTVTTAGGNLFLGENAGNFTMGSGATVASQSSYNIGIGKDALNSNSNGFYNVAIGASSMAYNTTGYRNTALGVSALYSNTSGTDNFALGYAALYGNTTGYSNVAIGNQTLENNNSYYNVGIGTQALDLNSSGYQNTGIGAYSLYYNTSGHDNMAIGAFAMHYNQTGKYNLALGGSALINNTSGDYNVAVGAQSLQNDSTGYQNTAVGEASGYNLTTGYNNTFIGYLSGYNASQKVDAVNSAAIGANTYTTASNQMVYGDNNITQHIFQAGNVGIGTVSPNAKLEISSGVNSLLRLTNTSGKSYELQSTAGSNLFNIRDINGAGDRFTIDGSGNVGINTVSPGARLEIVSGINSLLRLTNSGGRSYELQSTAGSGLFNIRDITAGADRITMDSNGNVGIGTVSPGANLEVYSSNSPTVRITQNGGLPGNTTLSLNAAGVNNTATINLLSAVLQSNTGNGTALFINPASDATHGFVGIGTGGPGYKLDVVGQINASGGLCIAGDCKTSWALASGLPAAGAAGNTLYSNGTNWVASQNIYNAGGNIGIGTANPLTKLDVAGTTAGAPGRTMTDDDGSFAPRITQYCWSGGGANYYGTRIRNQSGAIVFDNAPATTIGNQTFTERMRIDTAGNVGIGTTNPANKLTVSNSTATAIDASGGYVTGVENPFNNSDAVNKAWAEGRYALASANFWADRGSNNISNINTGNVGIGTTNPGTKLEVYRSQAAYTRVANFYDDSATGYPYIAISKQSAEGANSGSVLGFINNAGIATGFWTIAGDDPVANGTGIFLQRGGNVGIGTGAPGSKLVVAGQEAVGSGGQTQSYGYDLYVNANSPTVFVDAIANNGSPSIILQGRDSGGTVHPVTLSNSSTGNFSITGGSGNVGIGTNAPLSALNSTITDIGTGIFQTTASGNYNENLRLNRNSATGYASLILGGAYNSTSGTGAGQWTLYTYPNSGATAYGLQFDYNGNNWMYISPSGNVGIGTASPGARLTVAGDQQIRVGSVSGNLAAYMSYISGSNVAAFGGIGSNLELGSGWNEQVRVNAGNAGIQFNTTPGTGTFTTQMVIQVGGGVGIGTQSPTRKFVVSNGGAEGMEINPFSGYNSMISYNRNTSTWLPLILNDGAPAGVGGVGIGTNNPGAYKLYVNGDAYISGQITAGSGDVAEEFYTDKNYPAGTVLVMDNKPSYAEASAGEGYKSSRACNKKYDSTVIGVISEKPGMVVGQIEGKYKAPVALVGVIKVRANSSNGKIHQGDLLTTSAISGEAMLASAPQIGTIIGKALEDDSGKGFVMALVNLK
ncbi:MAG: hypothetical protein PHO56_05295, partial [Patescibacteria group bacterium]|nr:hypothetical protein [Patescibacteria group bacterium]